MALNKVMLIGNVGKDPEIRYIENGGMKVARLSLATSERYTDNTGQVQERTEWHTITAWRGLADVMEKYVKKGTQLFVEGKIRTREWTDNSGNKRYSTEIVADNIEMLGRRENSFAPKEEQKPVFKQPEISNSSEDNEVDDLPF